MNLLVFHLFVFFAIRVSAVPVPWIHEGSGNEIHVDVPSEYQGHGLEQVPIHAYQNVYLTNDTTTRYGYFLGRPVRRVFSGKIGEFFQSLVGRLIGRMPPLLHWAILITSQPPPTKHQDFDYSGEIDPTQAIGERFPAPDTGLVVELRHDAKTDMTSLNLKNWTHYQWRPESAMYLGPINKTDTEVITIGRVYLRYLLQGGFNDYRRNCQHFTAWYIQALWPDAPVPGPRVDQLFGKLLWWGVDWKKTKTWMLGKIYGEEVEELDSDLEFVKLEDLLAADRPASVEDNAGRLAAKNEASVGGMEKRYVRSRKIQ
jgi:hypothetical protein